jgi:1-acyl-sn-glycerol-3-phosphate acyltransferase
MQYIFEKVDRMTITYSGDAIPMEENAIVLSNHLSFADFYAIHSLALRKNMLSACKYFAKDSLKWIPGFGWGMWLMGMIFVSRDWTTDETRIQKVFGNIKRHALPNWIVSYPEGTRRTDQKRLESQTFCEKRGLPILQHLLFPRTKGFVAMVHALRESHIKAIYDLTILYLHVPTGTIQQPPNMLRIHIAPLDKEYKIHVHVRRFLIKDLPMNDNLLSQWLIDRFVEKDEWIERMNRSWLDKVNLVDHGTVFH